jgi:hypothetical protein
MLTVGIENDRVTLRETIPFFAFFIIGIGMAYGNMCETVLISDKRISKPMKFGTNNPIFINAKDITGFEMIVDRSRSKTTQGYVISTRSGERIKYLEERTKYINEALKHFAEKNNIDLIGLL